MALNGPRWYAHIHSHTHIYKEEGRKEGKKENGTLPRLEFSQPTEYSSFSFLFLTVKA